MIKHLLIVGIGGGAGSIARYLLHRLSLTLYPSVFPWGTFAVNIIGCFLIGLLWGSFTIRENETWKLLLMTGLCGGFTTFSAFTLESIQLLKEDRIFLFFIYVASSVIIGLLATYAGMLGMKQIN